MFTVYLSPSTQDKNPYAVGNTTEEIQMNEVADVVQEELSFYPDIKVLRNRPEMTLTEIFADSNKQPVHAHVAIHSNAYKVGVVVLGAEAWAWSATIAGGRLANSVYKYVSALTPETDRGVKYDSADGVANYGELSKVKAPSTIIEGEFHDNAQGATWILNNIENLGLAIAKGIIEFLETEHKTKLNKVMPQAPTSPPTDNSLEEQIRGLLFRNNELTAEINNLTAIVAALKNENKDLKRGIFEMRTIGNRYNIPETDIK